MLKGGKGQVQKEPDFGIITPVYSHVFFQWAKQESATRAVIQQWH